MGGGNFISKKHDIVLNFPYKDCVLQGGQDKDDQKRQEIFFNEIIAANTISNMLAPKVFTNAKRYTTKGVEENITFKDDDNLLIKGNNLIALSSILKRYEGKVKCIYIDPPYNTGNDSFNYNDNFNHSTWLTFMKNRLELLKRLLSEDGAIYVQLDYNSVHYAKVLMDEIFGVENFQREIIWRIGWVSGHKTKNNNWIRNHDTILYYSKNHNKLKFNKYYIDKKDFKIPTKNVDSYPIEDVWNGNEYDNLNSIAIMSFSHETISKMLDNNFIIKGQKPEKLVKRIIFAHTEPGDIVLDCFAGSATTAAVSLKTNRQFIVCEQLDSHIDIAKQRLNKVIDGDQSGISKSVNWQGGGSFVYCELLEDANTLINKIQEATLDTIKDIKDSIYSDKRIVPYITTSDLVQADDKFESLSLEEKKTVLISLINKNKLYVNYADIDDKTYEVKDIDKTFTKSFYKDEV